MLQDIQLDDKIYYEDAAVVAYRLPDSDLTLTDLNPIVTSSGGKFNLSLLTDGDLSTPGFLPYTKPGENAWIMFEFSQPETMQALTIVGGGYSGRSGFGADQIERSLEVSDRPLLPYGARWYSRVNTTCR